MSNETPDLRSIPATRATAGERANAADCIRHGIERAGALMLGAQALLREMKDADENDREIVAMLLDMAIEESDCLSHVAKLEAQS